jgi:hypothetical protein
MLTMKGVGACLVVATIGAATAFGQPLSLAGPSLALNRESVTVRIGGTPKPDEAVVTNKSQWVVVARSPANSAGVQLGIASVAATQFYDTTGLIRITFITPAPPDVDAVDVIALIGKPSRVTWSPKRPSGGLGFFAVEKREKADVYLFGSWVTGPDLAPAYNVDISVAAPPKDLAWLGENWRGTASAAVKSADHREIDPDSYLVSGKVGLYFPENLGDTGPYLDFQWEVVRFEFSRKEEFSNFVTGPTFTLSQRLLAKLTKARTVKAALDAELLGGIEVGHNMESKVVPKGYGAIFRLVPGIALYASFPGAFGLDEIRWTTTYRARILTTKEAFTDVRDDDHPFQSVLKGTRHEWKDSLDFKMTPLLAVTFSHEFGSTPPAFKILDHRYTLGATAMWAWKK